jgi:hypothetical protein
MSNKYPRILFFINGPSPSLDEQLAADQLAPCRVSFRNAKFVNEKGTLEVCDGWFGGATPKGYKKAYPHAKKAISEFVEKRKTDHETRAQKAEQARQSVAEGKADEAGKVAAKAATEADKKTKEAATKKAEADEAKKKAKSTKAGAKVAANADPAGASPSVDAAAKAAEAWTGNADA